MTNTSQTTYGDRAPDVPAVVGDGSVEVRVGFRNDAQYRAELQQLADFAVTVIAQYIDAEKNTATDLPALKAGLAAAITA